MTGVQENEYTIASTGSLLDSRARSWSFDIIDKFGIPREIFGKIAQPGTIVGPLLPQVIEEVGAINAKRLYMRLLMILQVQSWRSPPKATIFVYISSGTLVAYGQRAANPGLDGGCEKYDFTNVGGMNRTHTFSQNIMGLWIEQESRRQWAREGKQFFDWLSDAAMASRPLQCLINPNDYTFNAPGNMPERIAEYCRRTGQHVPESYGEIVRCIFDSLALCYRWTVDKIQQY